MAPEPSFCAMPYAFGYLEESGGRCRISGWCLFLRRETLPSLPHWAARQARDMPAIAAGIGGSAGPQREIKGRARSISGQDDMRKEDRRIKNGVCRTERSAIGYIVMQGGRECKRAQLDWSI